MAAWLLASLIFGLRWYVVLLGLAVWVLLITAGLKMLGWLWPRPPVLEPYGPGVYPGDFPPLAELLDEIAAASEWTPELNKRLEFSSAHESYDDWLESAAIDLAEIYKDLLQGVRPRKRGGIQQNFTLEELKAELRATASDIRIAAGHYARKPTEGKPSA